MHALIYSTFPLQANSTFNFSPCSWHLCTWRFGCCCRSTFINCSKQWANSKLKTQWIYKLITEVSYLLDYHQHLNESHKVCHLFRSTPSVALICITRAGSSFSPLAVRIDFSNSSNSKRQCSSNHLQCFELFWHLCFISWGPLYANLCESSMN